MECSVLTVCPLSRNTATIFLFFQNNTKNLDLSYKTDLDFWHCLGRVKLVL